MDRAERLLEALDAAVAKLPADAAILFSGGLDSGTLAGLAKRRGRPALYTVGVEGAADLAAAEEAAASLELPWRPVVVDEEDVLRSAQALLAMIPPDDPVALSFELPLHIVGINAGESDLITGQGADELFAGYGRYLSMGPEELEQSMESDLRRLLEEGAPRERTIAASLGKRIHHPFLDAAVIDAAAAFGPSELVRQGIRKAPLRDAAEQLSLGAIARREKKAAQYGSGIMRVLRSAAKKEGCSLSDYLRELSQDQTATSIH